MIDRKIINFAFLCAILLLVIITYIAYMNLNSLQSNTRLVKESTQSISLLNKIEKTLVDGETGQRGYIITKNNSYLEPYYNSKSEISKLLEQFESAAVKNVQDSVSFKKLERLINLKLNELNYTVNLKERNQNDSVFARISSNIGKVFMDSVRSTIKEMLMNETEALKISEEKTAQSNEKAIWSYAGGITASFIMIIFVFLSLKKENKLRKKMEAEANQSKLFFSTSLISIGDAVITTNETAVITFMNKIAEDLTKWSLKEAAGRPIETVFNIYREGTRETVPSPVKNAISTKKIVGLNNHTILVDKLNNEIHIDDSAAPILDEHNEVTGAVLIFRDITEKRNTEIKLERSYNQVNELNNELSLKLKELQILNHDLESFSYSVSHDLRAPLRSISGFSKIIGEEYDKVLDDEGKRLLQVINDNAVKMGVLIDELLNFSRLGKKALRLEIVDFNRVVHEAIAIVGNGYKGKDIIKVHSLLPAYVDEVLISEVWRNLIANSVKFTSKTKNPSIEIGCEVREGIVRYYVKDNGVGFNMESAGKLFGVFQRLHSDEEYAGNGVGLALCEKIIRLHGGTISAKSVPLTETVFSFTVPNKI